MKLTDTEQLMVLGVGILLATIAVPNILTAITLIPQLQPEEYVRAPLPEYAPYFLTEPARVFHHFP